jgi:hypothetical protein
MEDDVRYFARRSAEEREAATVAGDSRARDAHLQMAERYHDLATSIDARERFLAQKLDDEVGTLPRHNSVERIDKANARFASQGPADLRAQVTSPRQL